MSEKILPTKCSMDVMFEELSDEEELRTKAYVCSAGHLTVGVGHNLDADPAKDIVFKKMKVGDSVTMDQVMALFERDVVKVVEALDKRLPWFKKLSEARQYVLISMGFNMGVPGLMKFKNALGCLAKGDIAGTCYGMRMSKWFRQVGRRGPKLIRIMETDRI